MVLPLLLAFGGQALAGSLAGATAAPIMAGLAGAAGAGLGNVAGQLIETGEVDAQQALLSAAGGGLSAGFAPAGGAGGGTLLGPITKAPIPVAVPAQATNFLDAGMDAVGRTANSYFGEGAKFGLPAAAMQMAAGQPSGKWMADEADGQSMADSASRQREYVNKYLIPQLQRSGIAKSGWGSYGFNNGYQDGGVRGGWDLSREQQNFVETRPPPTDELAWEEAYPGKPFSPANMIVEGERQKQSGPAINGSMQGYIPADRQAQLRNQLFGANFEQKLQQSFVNPETNLMPGDYAAAFRYITGREPKPDEMEKLTASNMPVERLNAWSMMKEIQRKDEVRRMMAGNQPDPSATPQMQAAQGYIGDQKSALQAREAMGQKAQRGYAEGGANLGLAVPQAMMQQDVESRSRDLQKIFDMLILALSGELPEDEAQTIIQIATQVLGPEAVAEAKQAVSGGGKVVAGEPSATDNVVAQDASTGEPIKLASGEAILPAPMVEAAGGGLAGAKSIVGAAAQSMPQIQPQAERFMQMAHS